MLSAPSVKYLQVMGEEHLLLKQELTQQQSKIKGSYYSLGIKALQ